MPQEERGGEAAYVAWKDWQGEQFGSFSARDGLYYRWHVARATERRAAPLRVLELGFGNGGCMGWLHQQGHEVTGVEINPMLVVRAREAGFPAFTALQQVDAELRFDLIVAFDVLEHVPMQELQPFLSALAQKLATNGRVMLRFPNTESPFGQWYQNGDLTHVTALGLSRMRQLAPGCALQVLHSGDRLPWYCERWPSRPAAGFYHLVRRLFERFLRKMYRLDRSLDFSTNQLVVLAAAPAAPAADAPR